MGDVIIIFRCFVSIVWTVSRRSKKEYAADSKFFREQFCGVVRVTRLENINHLFCNRPKNLRCPTVSMELDF